MTGDHPQEHPHPGFVACDGVGARQVTDFAERTGGVFRNEVIPGDGRAGAREGSRPEEAVGSRYPFDALSGRREAAAVATVTDERLCGSGGWYAS